MRYISLCSGIEAASVAWGPLGWAPICFSEVEEFPSEVLRQRFPDVPNVGDVTTYDWSKYRGAADVVVFGSPCTSFSVAGLRKGLDDPKGRVMLSCLEAARSIRPRWVVIENVPALLSSHRGEDFQRLLETMAGFWPGGVSHGGFSAASSSAWPSSASVSSLSSALGLQSVPKRYYLTKRALDGLLRRVERDGRSLPSELVSVLATKAGA